MDNSLISRRNLCVYLVAFASQAGCVPSGELQIAPIDAEANRYLMSDGLDPRLYDTRSRRQYYHVANLEAASPATTQRNLDDFVRRRYSLDAVAGIEGLSILYYAQSIIADYGSEIHEAARSDTGFLPSYRTNLAAQIRLERLAGSHDEWSRLRVQYIGDKKRFLSKEILSGRSIFLEPANAGRALQQ
jgi:hypothetical protein